MLKNLFVFISLIISSQRRNFKLNPNAELFYPGKLQHKCQDSIINTYEANNEKHIPYYKNPINIRKWLEEMEYNYDKETNEGILPKSSASVSSGAYSIPGVMPVKNVFNDNYTIVNAKQVPQN